MKKHYFKNMIALVISMIMLFSDIAVFATNNEETIGEINQEQNLEYSTYWDNPNVSNLVVFLGMSEVGNYEDISEIKRGLDEVRDHFYSVSEGKLKIENIVPQYDINNDEMPLLVLEKSYEYYIEDEAKLIDEVVQYLNESAIISDTMNLHYSSDEDVLDNLTIIALGESVNEVLVSHVGTYEGEANVKEHSIHDYVLLTEQDLVDLEQGNVLEIMSEVLRFTKLEDSSKQIEEEISTTTEIIYGDTEEKNSDIMSFTNTGWYQTDGNWYYTQDDGNNAVGITEIEEKKYYFDDAGCLRSGWQRIDDVRYFFAVESIPQDCYLLCEVLPQEGWVEMTNGDRCYARSGGSVVAGWYTINDQNYYFDSYGILQKGWLYLDNKCYYADDDGKIVEGLVEIDGKKFYFDSVTGLKSGWVKIGTIRYFFAVETKPQDCYLLCEVLPKSGWVEMSNGDKCYAGVGGSVVAGWQTIDGQKYYFDSYGILKTGWFTVENVRYYGDEAKGIVASGLKEINGKTYGFHESGNYLLTGISTINGKKYFFDSDGLLQTGWIKAGSNWYYTDTSGEPAEGLFEIEGKKYYFDSETGLKKGWVKLGTIRYFFSVEPIPQECYLVCEVLPKSGWVEMTNGDKCYAGVGGSVVAGWQTIDGQKYYFDSYGILRTGWIKVGSDCYYADANGKVAEGLTEIDGQKYYFDSETGLKKGWVKLGTIRYFFAVEPIPQDCYQLCEVLPQEGWVEMSNGSKCYARSGGSVVAGWYTIDGYQYYFDSYGIMQTGWQTINGSRFFFNIDGIYIPMTAPVINSVTNEKYRCIDVKWNRVAGVKNYILEYSTDSNLKNVVSITFEGDAITEYQLEDVDNGQKYYFRLKFTVLTGTKETPEEIQSQYSIVKAFTVRGEVAPTANSAVISECKISSGSRESGMNVHLKAELKDHIKSADDKYYIVETESYGNTIDLATPIGSVDKDFEIDAEFVIDAGDGSDNVRESVDRALMNKFALAIKKEDGSYQVISEPMGITNPEMISENTENIFRAISKKGIQGIYYASDTNYGMLNAKDQNSKQTLINMNIEDLVGTAENSGYREYIYKGKTYYFSKCEAEISNIKSLNAGYDEYMHCYSDKESGERKVKVCVTVNLLLGYESADAYLIDPAARRSGYKYYTLNVREEKARETYEALFFYLGEIFGQDDCYVTNWILGNEVNSSRAWNYQGSLSQDAYMQVYASAFRLLYNGVKAAKSGNNVYISLDNGWTAAPDTYSGKSILDKFALYAQNENPDMKWSIAYHGYSYPLTRCDFWNDSSNTTFSTSTRYISMKNISVLTNYAATLEEKYDKPEGSIRIILSEQGYNAGQGAEIQAQALARGYYMAEFNDRVDAFIIRAVIDDADEMRGGLYLGIRSWDEKKRISFYVYEFMDSCLEDFEDTNPSKVASSSTNQNKVKNAKKILCDTDWESLVPGFSRSKLAGMY